MRASQMRDDGRTRWTSSRYGRKNGGWRRNESHATYITDRGTRQLKEGHDHRRRACGCMSSSHAGLCCRVCHLPLLDFRSPYWSLASMDHLRCFYGSCLRMNRSRRRKYARDGWITAAAPQVCAGGSHIRHRFQIVKSCDISAMSRCIVHPR